MESWFFITEINASVATTLEQYAAVKTALEARIRVSTSAAPSVMSVAVACEIYVIGECRRRKSV
jgi:hypothetical protein